METALKNFTLVEQFVESVCSYTSNYNNKMSVSYAPDNLIGNPVNYPNYGDFPDSYVLRTYGKWWSKLESAQKEYMPQDTGEIISEDYIIVSFEHPVVPSSIVIYETYNPGAVVRLWGGRGGAEWFLLWEGPPQVCEPSVRLFTPPIRLVKELIHLIRIELNQSHLRNHTSLDAVLLVGYKPTSQLQYNLLMKGLSILQDAKPKSDKILPRFYTGTSVFTLLPYELIVYILSFLDIKSLCRCAQVNKTFLAASSDCSLYRNLSLKRYWNKVTDTTLGYFMQKNVSLRKLDLSWCGNDDMITENTFIRFIEQCGSQLTHLSLDKCPFVYHNSLETIAKCKDLNDLRLRHLNICAPDNSVVLAELSQLVSLDLCASNVNNDASIIKILKNNPGLQHLIIDLCEELTDIDSIAETISIYNKRIRSFSCWKTHSLTVDGIKSLVKCPDLHDLDIGWCPVVTGPDDYIIHLAQGCPKLTRLIISKCRGLVDRQLLPLLNCTKLKQLDLLGARNISGEICEQLLRNFRDLELLDIGFCNQINHKQVALWRIEFPNVVIQRSCEFVVRNYWYNSYNMNDIY